MLESELTTLTKETEDLKKKWQAEKADIGNVRDTKVRIEKLRGDIEKAEREGNLEKAAELKYGHLTSILKSASSTKKSA